MHIAGRRLLFSLALLLLLATAAAAQQLWVNSADTPLKSARKASAETLATLQVGDEVTVLESKRRWHRVRSASGAEGWAYAGKLVDAPPQQEVAGEDGLLFGAMADSQIDTAKADSARSIRGLSPETAAYAEQRGTPAEIQQELDVILTYQVSEEQLQTFLREGGIGEYAP